MPARMLRDAARAGAVFVVVAIAMILARSEPGRCPRLLGGAHFDDLYGAAKAGGADAYLYAPAFAQALAPFKALPWPVFAGLWLLFMALCLVAIAGVWAILVAFIPPVLIELQAGNIHLPLAAGHRSRAALPGHVGLRAPDQADARRRPAVVRGAPRMAPPGDRARFDRGDRRCGVVRHRAVRWAAWIDALIANAGHPISPDYSGVIHIPLLVRLPIAGADRHLGRADRSALDRGVATTLALPILWVNGLAVLLALPLLVAGTRPDPTPAPALMSEVGGAPGLRRHGHELAIREEPDALRE